MENLLKIFEVMCSLISIIIIAIEITCILLIIFNLKDRNEVLKRLYKLSNKFGENNKFPLFSLIIAIGLFIRFSPEHQIFIIYFKNYFVWIFLCSLINISASIIHYYLSKNTIADNNSISPTPHTAPNICSSRDLKEYIKKHREIAIKKDDIMKLSNELEKDMCDLEKIAIRFDNFSTIHADGKDNPYDIQKN